MVKKVHENLHYLIQYDTALESYIFSIISGGQVFVKSFMTCDIS